MQTFMHSPHLTHRFRNSGSSRDPGGRISDLSANPFFEKGVERNKGTVTSPMAAAVKTLRLPRSSVAEAPTLPNPNFIASCGHISSQFRQAMHSVCRQTAASSDKALPWHSRVHRPQEVQPSLTDLFRKAYLESTPRRAPRGQRYLHQNRFCINVQGENAERRLDR